MTQMETKMIGNKIAEARKKLNISQAQLADSLFISAQAVGKWERGESMPDITTLNRLAGILGVDLNYFSGSFHSISTEIGSKTDDLQFGEQKKRHRWDMSLANLVDADFSGLKNLQEKFSFSNMQRCLFVGSEMSGLLLKSNNIESCDFSNSNINSSNIQRSNLANNIFKNCSLKETGFVKSYIEGCDFSGADFTGVEFKYGGFGNNIITNAVWNSTSFNEMQIADIVFEGKIVDCFFENCAFTGVTFQNATLINTFFKNNKKLKRVRFVDCKADSLTYAFLKNGKADLNGITLIKQ